jgi:hypothetical protein
VPEFDACIGGYEVPIGLGVVCIAVVFPGGDLVDEALLVGNAAVETLGTPSSDSARSSQLPCLGV